MTSILPTLARQSLQGCLARNPPMQRLHWLNYTTTTTSGTGSLNLFVPQDYVCRQSTNLWQDTYSDADGKGDRIHSSVELPSLRDTFRQDSLPPSESGRRELLPSILAHSPPGRYNSLPPIQRREREKNRQRKSSVTENARKPKHEKSRKSRDYTRRMSIDGRKAMSAEPPTAAWVQGKRWEDLIEAATSATEADSDHDSTPVSPSESTLPFRFLW